jgi:hypothetical protein
LPDEDVEMVDETEPTYTLPEQAATFDQRLLHPDRSNMMMII